MKGVTARARVPEKEYRALQSEVFKVASRSRELGGEKRELVWKIEGLEKEIRMLTVKKKELVRGRRQKGMSVEVDSVEDRSREKKYKGEGWWRLAGVVCSVGLGLMMMDKVSRQR